MLDVLEKCVLFPWIAAEEIKRPQHNAMLGEIQKALFGDLGFDPRCEQPPTLDWVVQAIALPTIIYLEHTRFYARRTDLENPWLRLTEAERNEVRAYYYMNKDAHRMVYQYVPSPQVMQLMGSYIAATFAYTTKNIPRMYPMELVMEEFMESGFGEWTKDYASIRNTGLLLVTAPTTQMRGMQSMAGNMYSLFSRRIQDRRVTVFLDTATGQLAKKGKQRQLPNRDDFQKTLEAAEIGKTRLGELIVDECTYVSIPGKPLENMNECRKPVTL